MRLHAAVPTLLTLLAMLVSACSGSDETTAEPTHTYHRDIAPRFMEGCTGCHSVGASAPFALDNLEDAQTWAQASLDAIEGGRMPPWLPETSCREFVNERMAPPGTVEALAGWIASGMPAGDPADAPAASSEGTQKPVFQATHVAKMPSPYLPDSSLPDDYRCFVLDLEIPEEQFLLSSRPVPGQTSLVHHILVYAVHGESLTEVLEADAADGVGYSCFGAPFPSTGAAASLSDAGRLPTLVGTWVPGSQPTPVNPEISTHIPAGSRIVMQIHYNSLGGQVEEDQSHFEMIMTSEPTAKLAASRPILLPNLFAAANDPEAVNQHLFKNYTDEPITIVRLGAHMHLLGSRYKTEVVRANGERECALEIPQWDFNWQEGYYLPEDDPIVLAPGDGLSLECVYDNTLSNQPSVNGVVNDPEDIYWGEGTRDEMCMNYLTMIEPYKPSDPAGTECGGMDTCLASCPEGRSAMECLLDCPDVSPNCLGCALLESASCATECVTHLLAVRDHDNFGPCFVNRMALGSSLDRCLAAEVPEAYGAYTECLAPLLADGACAEAWPSCGFGASTTTDP